MLLNSREVLPFAFSEVQVGTKWVWTRGHFSESLYWHCCDIHSMLHNLNHNRLLCIQSMIDKLEKERVKFDFFLI